jgi:hypothetical protein
VLISGDGIDNHDGGIVGDVVHDDYLHEVYFNHVHDVSFVHDVSVVNYVHDVPFVNYVHDVPFVHDVSFVNYFNYVPFVHDFDHDAGNYHDSHRSDHDDNGHPFGAAGDRLWRHSGTTRFSANAADSRLAFAGRVLGCHGLQATPPQPPRVCRRAR